MAVFADGAERVDEGVNVQALYFTLLAVPLTIASMVLVRRQQHENSSDRPDREPPA